MYISVALDPSNSAYVPDIDEVHADSSPSNHDPFKFSHGLTGVDQPSNYFFVNILIATALVPVALSLCFRIMTTMRNNRRRISVNTSCRGNKFWTKDRYSYWGSLKQQFLYAPVWTNRHHELGSSSAAHMVTLPTRPQLAIIAVYFLSNIAYCVAIPDQPRAQMFAEFRGRCGALAAFNLIFTVLFALRNNPLIGILQVSYNTFNLFHRCMARLVVLESIAHVFAFMYNAFQVTYDGRGGWHSVAWILQHSISYRWGLTAFIAFLLTMIHSLSPIRHAFYETFITLHRIGIAVAISGIYFHLAKHALPQLPWIYLVISLLALEPLIRITRILFYNFSWRRRIWTQVTLEALPGEATCVTFVLPRSWNASPGTHMHIYLPKIALWSSHPFSVAWYQSAGYAKLSSEKLPSTIDDRRIGRGATTISCVVRARTGMTRSLYKLALQSKGDKVQQWGAIEGPYGGYRSFESYGTVVLFAAGVGITHQLSFVHHLLEAHNSSTAATHNILLVWCITNIEVLEWIQPWLEEIAAMQNFCEVVRIRLHVSRMAETELAISSLPVYLDVRSNRCEVQDVVDEEVLVQVGAMVVSVCGPGGFNDSVRAAVRRRVGIRSIDFVEEAFTY
ncbi:ferric reductase [Clathrospora elynae]|uniref:Ferric reductase n=1 Tax=Clathrospora elynae TaxID=706981 RepID=A0A6A5SUJ0_9PLEO|nr:ferric reductase [Clathrospora elynae]